MTFVNMGNLKNDKSDGDDIVIPSSNNVTATVAGREREVMQAAQRAYEVHAQEHTSLPHSAAGSNIN